MSDFVNQNRKELGAYQKPKKNKIPDNHLPEYQFPESISLKIKCLLYTIMNAFTQKNINSVFRVEIEKQNQIMW